MHLDYEKIYDQISDAKLNQKPLIIKNALNKTPGWQNFIDHLNYEYHKPDTKVSVNPHLEYFINGVLFKRRLYLFVHNPNINFYPELDGFYKFLNSIGEYSGSMIGAYINFAQELYPIRHHDKKDHIYWQCIGKTEWKFYDGNTENYDSFLVEQGYIVFIPKFLDHEVESPGSRAAIQATFELKEK
jgi:hypothetical protein